MIDDNIFLVIDDSVLLVPSNDAFVRELLETIVGDEPVAGFVLLPLLCRVKRDGMLLVFVDAEKLPIVVEVLGDIPLGPILSRDTEMELVAGIESDLREIEVTDDEALFEPLNTPLLADVT